MVPNSQQAFKRCHWLRCEQEVELGQVLLSQMLMRWVWHPLLEAQEWILETGIEATTSWHDAATNKVVASMPLLIPQECGRAAMLHETASVTMALLGQW
jgi:hypothetical protein